MNKFLFFNLVVSTTFLISCAPMGMWPFGSSNDIYVEPYACPASYIADYAHLKLSSAQVIPTKMAILIDGQTKYDECQNPSTPSSSPLVIPKRTSASQNEAAILVTYFKDNQLPGKISIEILDRGDCSTTPTSFYAQTEIPLDFKKQYYDPNHSDCGSYNRAEANLTN